MATQVLKLGDRVEADYHGLVFVGVITDYDGSGYVFVEPATPVVVYGSARDLLAFSPTERHLLRVIEAGPDLTDADVVSRPAAVLGGASLRCRRTNAHADYVASLLGEVA